MVLSAFVSGVRLGVVAGASRFKDTLVVAVDYLCEFALVKALLCLERVKYVKKSLFHAPDYRRRRNPPQQCAGAPRGNAPPGALCEHHEQVGKEEADKAAGGEGKYPRKNHVAGNSPVNALE